MGYTAIFGGTFNPFHIGHYEMLKALEADENIDEIFLLPDKIPPHKTSDYLVNDKHRIEMCNIVAADFKKVSVCLCEFEREEKSYSYDTVVFLKEKYPQKQFIFAIGGDMLVTLDTWYKADELVKLIPFIAFMRADTDATLFSNKIASLKLMGANIFKAREQIPCVSSTFIRNNIEKAQEFLPKKVYDYIKSEAIYGEH
ncbi:MAG: nicotinate (nicotinamide) nucleotide adenylyltransferase [Clostridia bacterium]|nr:nicotinate (nicotinamide) nucleotide adenylyltransferase [Clostridia bacterium]